MSGTPVTVSAVSGTAAREDPLSGVVVAGAPRLEVRWIRPGTVDRRALDWFAQFPILTESRVDMYLSDPDIEGQSVKMRGGRTLEVKAHRGQRGELVLPGRARGVLEAWQRWSFPGGSARWAEADPPAWTSVSKVRRMTFVHGDGDLSAGSIDLGRETGCAVELTDVCVAGQRWWTMSLEAGGPESDLRGIIERAAVTVLSGLPAGIEFHPRESRSYAAWLRTRPCARFRMSPVRLPRHTGSSG